MFSAENDEERENDLDYRTTDMEVHFDSRLMSLKEKIVWTFKLWFGFAQKIKVKVKR